MESLLSQEDAINKLINMAQTIESKNINIVNTNITQAVQYIENNINQNDFSNIFISSRDLTYSIVPYRQNKKFQQTFQPLLDQKIIHLSHQQVLDIKFREISPLITSTSLLIFDNAEYLLESSREAFSMHLTKQLLNRSLEYLLQQEKQDIILQDPRKSILNIVNFDLSKQSHLKAFQQIRFRNSAYTLPFLTPQFIPQLSISHFIQTIIRSISAISDLLQSDQSVLAPELFLKLLTEKYSVDINILQFSVQYYHNYLQQKNTFFQPLVTILQFLQLMSTFSHPVIHYQIEKSAETHGQRFFESNSFHLIIQKGKDGKLHKSEPVLSYICSDPLVALRFILERFETIIFLSNQIPISVEKDKSKEKLSQILRINYFNRKSQFSFNTKFYDIQADIYGFYRYQKKGADQTLLLSSEKDIQPSLALNYQKFVQQRSTQSRDGVVIYTPNKQFSARLIQRLKDQNLSLSTFQSSFIISPDQIESASVKKFYRLSCNIGRGGLLVTNFNDTHSNEFTQQYNSISLILGVPFPQKSLRNKLFTFYDFRVFDKQPGDLWHQMAARNIIGSCSGQTALICADMRYSLQIQKWFPRWFLKYFQEEGAGCLHELKNWVINKSE